MGCGQHIRKTLATIDFGWERKTETGTLVQMQLESLVGLLFFRIRDRFSPCLLYEPVPVPILDPVMSVSISRGS